MSKSKKGKGNEKIKAVLGILGFLFLYAIIEAYILPLNPEIFIQNWGIGVVGIIVFSTLYLINIEKFLFRPKKLWFFMIMVSLCWLIKDWADFIMFMRGG